MRDKRPTTPTRPFRPAPALIVIAIVAGCGPADTVRVTGKLVKGGAPYRVPSGQRLGVTLYALSTGDGTSTPGEPYAAEVDNDASTFRVTGREGRGVPLGKYRVAIHQKWTREGLDSAKAEKGGVPDRDEDFFRDAFGPRTSPIVRDLKESPDLTIDLDGPGTAGPDRNSGESQKPKTSGPARTPSRLPDRSSR